MSFLTPSTPTKYPVVDLGREPGRCNDAVDRHIIFVCDATGSMHAYVQMAKVAMKKLLSNITSESNITTGISIVFFRDHADSYVVTKVKMCRSATALMACVDDFEIGGGSDEPEALAEAMRAAAELAEEGNSSSPPVVVLIGDAPPHGVLRRDADDYPLGGPPGEIVDLMAQCDRLARVDARLVCVLARDACCGPHAYITSTVFAAMALRISSHVTPMIFSLAADDYSATLLTGAVTGAAAIAREDAELEQKIRVAREILENSSPGLLLHALEAAIANNISFEGTEMSHDGHVAYNQTAARSMASAQTLSEIADIADDLFKNFQPQFGEQPPKLVRLRVREARPSRIHHAMRKLFV